MLAWLLANPGSVLDTILAGALGSLLVGLQS